MNEYIESIKKRFLYYKSTGEKAIQQLTEEQLFDKPSPESNSIAIIVNHLHGNMLSRWTNFYTEDGEKEWRNRDAEFENEILSEKELKEKWDEGWACVFGVIDELTITDLQKKVFIRSEKHSVIDAINRQLTHYSYHIGQIVYIAKFYKDKQWASLTIPKGKSKEFNRQFKKQ